MAWKHETAGPATTHTETKQFADVEEALKLEGMAIACVNETCHNPQCRTMSPLLSARPSFSRQVLFIDQKRPATVSKHLKRMLLSFAEG